ncbi:hypothetical protein B0H14DRAFT_3446835 [Mycena olivaceomarginata]|nr:hypothetical protein B0H14DRAFT_3446835 [Mycena olivaceomarginata]
MEVHLASFEPSFTPRVMYFPRPAAQSSVLANLPAETIFEVYSHLKYQGLVDVVCLSITCQSLWNIGRAEIYRLLEIRAVNWNFPWAGDRIICVGDYLRRDDLPDDVLSPEEVDEFTGLDEDGEHYYTFHALGSLIFDYEPTSLASRPTQPAVLRNVSRLQYIRESALVTWKARAQTEIKETKDVGFGQIVLSRICFSTDSTVAMAYEGDIHRGVWAGDRFDIVGSEWLEGAVGWTDVSDEVLAEVEAIWRSEYGYGQ